MPMKPRNKDMNRVSVYDLLEVVKEHGMISVDSLHKRFGVTIPPDHKLSEDESDRPRIWSIRQGLAQLERERYIDFINTYRGKEVVALQSV